MTDKSIIHTALVERVTQPLIDARINVFVFDEIEPKPKDTTLLQGAQAAKNHQAEIIIGLGCSNPKVSYHEHLKQEFKLPFRSVVRNTTAGEKGRRYEPGGDLVKQQIQYQQDLGTGWGKKAVYARL